VTFRPGSRKDGAKKYPSTHNLIRTLSKLGLCSRSQALLHVQAGRVRVNGKRVTDPGRVVGPHDKIHLAGEAAKPRAKRYFLFYKPAGCVTTRSDEKGRRTIYDFLEEIGGWVFPVGRLDLDSEGLLVLTNDTAFGNQLTEPSYKVPRTYEVWVKGTLGADDQSKISQGLYIGRGETSLPARLKIIKAELPVSHGEVTLIEGKNREVRRLFDVLGKPVVRLLRTKFGSFALGDLKPGTWKEINPPTPPAH
jgi:23S rRNA pseudouridine2605 synthase